MDGEESIGWPVGQSGVGLSFVRPGHYLFIYFFVSFFLS